MKGIVLAGGTGTRLAPVTDAVCKQLLPIYNKPLIYYSLSVLLQAGIRDILVIGTPKDMPRIQDVLGDGSQFGVAYSYAVQPRPEGIAQAFVLGRAFIGNDAVALVLGDNLFFGAGLEDHLLAATARETGATIFVCQVHDPERYGVVTLDAQGCALAIEEKPSQPRSPWAVTGLYVYDNRVLELASSLTPSARGELEITDINRAYLGAGTLTVAQLGRGIAWMDTGTHESMLQASSFIHAIEQRQRISVGCLEEIAFRNGWIDCEQLAAQAARYQSSSYGAYLHQLVQRA